MGIFKKKKQKQEQLSKEQVLNELKESAPTYTDEGIKNLCKPFENDREFLLEAVEYSARVWNLFSEVDKNNLDLAKDILFSRNLYVWKYLSPIIKNQPGLMEDVLIAAGEIWRCFTDEEKEKFCADKENLFSFCMNRLKSSSNGWSWYISYCMDKIADEDKILKLIETEPVVFKYAPTKISYSASFLERVMELNPGLYKEFSEDQRKIYDDYLNSKRDKNIEAIYKELNLLKAEIIELRLALPKTSKKQDKKTDIIE